MAANDDVPIVLSEAAKKFKINGRTLRRAAIEGRLGAVKSGGVWITTGSDMGRWIAKGKHTPGPKPKESRQQGVASE